MRVRVLSDVVLTPNERAGSRLSLFCRDIKIFCHYGSANPRMGNTGEMHSFGHANHINSQRSGQVSWADFSPKHWDITASEWVDIKRPGLRRTLNTGVPSMRWTKGAAASLIFHVGLRRCPALQSVNQNTLERRREMFPNKHGKPFLHITVLLAQLFN